TSSRRTSAVCDQRSTRDSVGPSSTPFGGLAMSSARPTSRGRGTLGRVLRSASFRLTLFYAVLFMASAGALFATVYVTATAAMQNDMAAVLRSEAYQLAEIHSRSGLTGLAQQITRRINFRTR